MGITTLDLWAWASIYFGIGLVRASLSDERKKRPDYDPRGKFAYLGYVMLGVGLLFLIIRMLQWDW